MKDYYWLNEDSKQFLERGYLQKGESPKKRIRAIAEAAEKYLRQSGFADKFEDYMKRGFYSLSSPVWSNFGKDRGLPISCNGVYIDDKMDSILRKQAEVGMQTKHGSGTSGYFGDLRGRGVVGALGSPSSNNNRITAGTGTLGGISGNATNTITAANLPDHEHDLKSDTNDQFYVTSTVGGLSGTNTSAGGAASDGASGSKMSTSGGLTTATNSALRSKSSSFVVGDISIKAIINRKANPNRILKSISINPIVDLYFSLV